MEKHLRYFIAFQDADLAFELANVSEEQFFIVDRL
jgi:hypothetical protein